MLVARVIQEFSDYRAYVSHDLCKQRFLMPLSDLEAGQGVLRDRYAWPLLSIEVKRLFGLGPTLFGLDSPVLEEVADRAEAYLSRMESLVPGVFEGLQHDLVKLRETTLELGRLLGAIPDQMRERRPGFSEEAVRKYLDGRDSERCLQDFRAFLTDRMMPAFESLSSTVGTGGTDYEAFWELTPDAALSLRCVIVAAAVEDEDGMGWDVVRDGRRILEGLYHVASAWSPSVSPEHRRGVLDGALESFGYSTTDELLQKIGELARGE